MWKGLGVLILCLLSLLANAQEGLVIQGGFKFAPGGYYPPPHEKQLKSLLTGSKAQAQPGGRYLITDGKFETFFEDGRREMLVEAPECFYEAEGDHSLHSPGALRLEASEGKFWLTGEGFHWQETNSTLFISNRVHTMVHPDLLQSRSQPPPQPPPKKDAGTNQGIEITSDRFDYFGGTGLGNYRQNVHVTGTELDLSAADLEFLLPMKEKQLQRLTAQGEVHVTSGEIQAAGQQAIYTPDTGLVHVLGQPTWQAALRQGSGDELFMDRSNRIFRAVGHALLTMPRESLGASGLIPVGTNASTAPLTNQIVEIRSDTYELRTNAAAFREQVRVTERAGEQVLGTLSCGQMTAAFAASNQLARLEAWPNVSIQQETRKFTAERAVYTGTNTLLELTGRPAWQDGDRQGRGDILLMDTAQNQLTARSNAWLRLPANELAQSKDPEAVAVLPGSGPAKPTTGEAAAGPGPTPVSKPKPPAGTNQFAEIVCQEYTLRPESGWFEGGVQVTHPQMQLSCQTAQLDFPHADNKTQRLIAREAVEFDLLDERGQKIHGTGQKAVYTYSVNAGLTNDSVELTGNPMLTMTNGTFKNQVIILDRARGKLIAPGQYLIRGVAEAGTSNLNPAPNPKTKSRKKRPSAAPPQSYD